MTTTLERTTDFREHLSRLGFTGSPERRAAMDRFEELGIPTVKNEEWKYTNLRALAEQTFTPVTDQVVRVDDLPSLPPICRIDAVRVVMLNGLFSPVLSDGAALAVLAPQVSVRGLAEVEGDRPLVDGTPFVALNAALWQDGLEVAIKPGTIVEKPILILNLAVAVDNPVSTHTRLEIKSGAGSQAKIIEAYYGLAGTTFNNVVARVDVEENAHLEHIRIQNETESSFHIATTKVRQAGGSVYTSNNVSFGGRLARNDFEVWVGGEHAETALNGAYTVFGEQLIDNHTRIDHAMPNCHSFEVYKGILGDHGIGVFNGKIYVHQDAQKTDAKQTNKALLLSRTAIMNAKPQLEIFADDVKCTHGATVGQIEEDQLFYLRSRGLATADARTLLTYAFVSELLEKISVVELREMLEEQLLSRVRATQIAAANP